MTDFESVRKRAILIGTISVGSFGIFHFTQTLKKYYSKKNRLTNTKFYNPQELHYLANSISQPLFKPNPSNPTELIARNTIVEGIVDTKAPITSIFSEKQLIYSEMRRLPIYSNNYLFKGAEGSKYNESKLLFQHSTNFELYSLYDKKKTTPCILTRDSLSGNQVILEETGSITMKLPDLSLLENILVFLGLIYESLLFWFLPTNVTNGIFIGYSDKEFGIRTGGLLSLVGDLVYNTNNKTLVLRNTNSVEMLLKKLDRKIAITQIKLGCFVGIGFGIIGLLIYRKTQVKVRNYNSKVPGNLINIENVLTDEGNLCIICCEKPRSILPKPCLHLSCCKKCFEMLKKKECPICREKFEGYNEIFMEKDKTNLFSKK